MKYITSLIFILFTTNIFSQIAHVHDGAILANTTNTYTIAAPSDNIHIIGSTFSSTVFAGILYDSGGENGDYSDNESFSFGIGNPLFAHFMELIIEYDMESPYDSLTIVDDGVTVAHFTGTGVDTMLTSDSQVQVYFNSNSVNVGSGFSIEWRVLEENLINSTAYPELYDGGVKFMWDPSKAALRAGTFVDNEEDLGDYSAAFGFRTTASGDYSIASGLTSTASGSSSVALGANNVASGSSSMTWGVSNEALGSSSTAWGTNTIAEGTNSTSWGLANNALGDYSTAWGVNADALGEYSTAFGRGLLANAYLETVLGRYNSSGGLSGDQTNWVSTQRLFVVGNGTSSLGNNAFVIYKDGDGFLEGTLTQSSDRILKEKIKPIKNASSIINQLNGYTYYWKDKEQRDSNKQVGVIAQEVQKVLPELVRTDENEHLSVNYIGLTPVLIEANKELKVENEELKVLGDELLVKNAEQSQQIEDLEARLSKIEDLLSQNDSFKTENPTQSIHLSPTLKQNTPNPFYHKTQIECFVPKTTKNAIIQINDVEGKVVKVVEIENRGEVVVHISGKSLEQGTYFYSLVVDEEVVDTKQMILTK